MPGGDEVTWVEDNWVERLEMLAETLSEFWGLAEQGVRGKVTVATIFVIDPEAYVSRVSVDIVDPHCPAGVDD